MQGQPNEKRTSTVHVAAGIIFDSGRLLVCQRKEGGPFALKWEFPGGKVEPGEGHLEALQRELKEELGIEVCSATEAFRCQYLYPDGMEVQLVFFRVEHYRGTVENRTFQSILWADPGRLKELDFLEADRLLIEKLIRRELTP